MAVTKILARKGRLDVGVRYVLNGDKTNEQILTTSQGCSMEHAVSRMMKTKRHYRQMDGVQYYHISPSSPARSPQNWRWRLRRSLPQSISLAMRQ